MCQQDAIQVFETETALENLALGPFRAIEQKAFAFVDEHRRSEIALDAGRGGGGAEKMQLEHDGGIITEFGGIKNAEEKVGAGVRCELLPHAKTERPGFLADETSCPHS